jgi:hypothetical protein
MCWTLLNSSDSLGFSLFETLQASFCTERAQNQVKHLDFATARCWVPCLLALFVVYLEFLEFGKKSIVSVACVEHNNNNIVSKQFTKIFTMNDSKKWQLASFHDLLIMDLFLAVDKPCRFLSLQ